MYSSFAYSVFITYLESNNITCKQLYQQHGGNVFVCENTDDGIGLMN